MFGIFNPSRETFIHETHGLLRQKIDIPVDGGVTRCNGEITYLFDYSLPIIPQIERIKEILLSEQKKMYGKTYFGTERTTFIIGPDGKIKTVLPKVKPDQHLEKVLELL